MTIKLNARFLMGLALCASFQAGADTTPVPAVVPSAAATPPASVSAEAAAPAGGSLIGIIDIRPSVIVGKGAFYTENALEAGYKFSSKFSLSYVQFVNTNIHDPELAAQTLNVTFPGAFIRARVNDIGKIGSVGVSYQNRTYLPITSSDQEKGKIASVRNYINFTQKLSDSISLTLTEMPVFHLFSKAGAGTAANPVFENRVYLMPTIQFSEKLSLYVPIMFHQTRYRNFAAGAANNDAWGFFLWANPELDYELNANTTLAIGYYSDNLVKSDLSAFSLSKGLSEGVFQAAVTVSL